MIQLLELWLGTMSNMLNWIFYCDILIQFEFHYGFYDLIRSTTIPEDLGRISYLLTDKTGTLTQNEMVFKRLVLANSQADSPEDVRDHLKSGLRSDPMKEGNLHRITETARVTEAIKALAVCHNVTPVYEASDATDEEMDYGVDRDATYQASSPDEVGINSPDKSFLVRC